jgi:hypothetical protein
MWDPDTNRSANPDPDWESEFGSRQAKIIPQKREKFRNFMFKEFSVGLEASGA